MIENGSPSDWIDLQNSACMILNESGLVSETPKKINTVRGTVEIDVYAVDEEAKPKIIYICECKNWKTSVPQEKIYAFRAVMDDIGANIGLMISSSGFQVGAYEVSQNTNIMLLNWKEFQNIFAERWYKNHFVPTLSKVNESLSDYTERINSGIFRKVDLLDNTLKDEFKKFRNKYSQLSCAASYLCYYFEQESKLPKLPLKIHDSQLFSDVQQIPEEILNATSYRDLLNYFELYIRKATGCFDKIFGETV